MELTPTGTWDTLGLRGTCSRAGLLRSDVPPEFVLGDFAEILALTSLPVGNVLLGSTWVGIAEAAAAAAHASVRADARRNREKIVTAARTLFMAEGTDAPLDGSLAPFTQAS